MFNYSLRTKFFLSLALVSMLIIISIIIFDSQKKSKDLLLVSQVKILADSLERYYDKFNAYPEIEKTDLVNVNLITDKGVNDASGKKIYFQENLVLAGQATIVSNADNYSIEFKLYDKWPVWNITKNSGGKCRIIANALMQCVNLK